MAMLKSYLFYVLVQIELLKMGRILGIQTIVLVKDVIEFTLEVRMLLFLWAFCLDIIIEVKSDSDVSVKGLKEKACF